MLLRRSFSIAVAVLIALASGAALAKSPFGVGLAEQASPGFLPWIGQMQQQFYGNLRESLSALSEGGRAGWWLAGLSFLYGVVHAIGPGHGKIVISSYLLANEETAKRGIIISLLAAMTQATVAVILVSIVAVVLNMTAIAMTQTAEVFEIGSYVMITALGLYLFCRKAVSLLKSRQRFAPAALGAAPAGAELMSSSHLGHSDHDHGHDGACCHHHFDPNENIGKKGIAGATAAILSVGLRPCSGALIVLVFALSQGIYWAGIVSAYLMGLGTAFSVAILATLALGARDLALRFAGADSRTGRTIMSGLELAAALFITLFGLVLLGGALSI